MAEHQWSPPEHQDITLHQSVSFDPDLAGPLALIDPPEPVWADIRFEQISDKLHLKCVAGRSPPGFSLNSLGSTDALLVARHEAPLYEPMEAVACRCRDR